MLLVAGLEDVVERPLMSDDAYAAICGRGLVGSGRCVLTGDDAVWTD